MVPKYNILKFSPVVMAVNSYIKGGMQAKGIWKQNPKAII